MKNLLAQCIPTQVDSTWRQAKKVIEPLKKRAYYYWKGPKISCFPYKLRLFLYSVELQCMEINCLLCIHWRSLMKVGRGDFREEMGEQGQERK